MFRGKIIGHKNIVEITVPSGTGVKLYNLIKRNDFQENLSIRRHTYTSIHIKQHCHQGCC